MNMAKQTADGSLPPRVTKWTGLQSLRAVAAILVLWTHLKFALGDDWMNRSMFIRSAAGAFGVDVFFVISGFVISLVASEKESNWKRFLIHRFARVVPFYWLASLLLLLPKLAHFGSIHPLQIWNSFLFLPVLDRFEYTNPIHPYGWSLGFEIWFYLVFGASLLFAKKKAPVVMMSFLLVGTILMSCLLPTMDWFLPRFLFSPMVLEFCCGILIFRFRDRIPKGLVWPVLAFSALAFLGVLRTESLGKHLEVLKDPRLGWERATVWGGAAASLVLAVVLLERSGRKIWPNWLVRLGDASYSLYLVQPLVLLAVRKFVPDSAIMLRGGLFVAGSIAVAPFAWRWVEVPLTRNVRIVLERIIPVPHRKIEK